MGLRSAAAVARLVGAAFTAALCLLCWPTGAQAGDRAVKSLLEMRRENVVIQQWDLSCGAAALATLLKYQHGEQVTEKEVALSLMKREEYIQNPKLVQAREGFSLLDLKRHVDARGYQGNGFGKLGMKDLVAKAPLIVPISTNGYNHFVIFRGRQGDRVLLADPAWGNRTMRVDEFLVHWIEYPTLGRIGFAVQRNDGIAPSNLLAPTMNDFVSLH
ncbi:MAG TPA: C39 family peptidase [Noviherbaspirillum sp.]|nr:C39 family peptidase [Noviherbaspirillum sp.]